VSAGFVIGIAGCGRLAEAGYVPAAARACVRVGALADPDKGRLEAVAAAVVGAGGVRPAIHPTLGDLLAQGGVDAVVIASPPDAHEAGARAASAAGVPALVEKPPAPNLAGARRIAALDPPPWIGFNRRFSLGLGAAESVPVGGSIDLEIRYRRFSWSPVSVRDPALTDLAPHLVDLALIAGVGKPRSVTACSSSPERVTIEIDGERATATIRCACDRAHRERLTVRDQTGSVLLRRASGGAREWVLGRLRRGPHPLVASLAAQLDALGVAAGLRPVPLVAPPIPGGAPATASDGVRAMRVVAAAAASLARDGAVVETASAEVTGAP
jgi:predicted dehydrogenase